MGIASPTNWQAIDGTKRATVRRVLRSDLLPLAITTFVAVLMLMGGVLPATWDVVIGKDGGVPVWPFSYSGSGPDSVLAEMAGRLLFAMAVALAWRSRRLGAAVMLLTAAYRLIVGTAHHSFQDSYAWPVLQDSNALRLAAMMEIAPLFLLSTSFAFWFTLVDATAGRRRRIEIAVLIGSSLVVGMAIYYLLPPKYVLVRRDASVRNVVAQPYLHYFGAELVRLDRPARFGALRPSVTEIDARGQSFTRKQLESIAAVPTLAILTLDECDLTEHDLAPLLKSTSLRHVFVRYAKLSDAAVDSLDQLGPGVNVVTDGWHTSEQAKRRWALRHPPATQKVP